MTKILEINNEEILRELEEKLKFLSKDYKNVKEKFDRLWFYDDNGNFCILNGYQELSDKMDEINLDIFKTKVKITEIKSILKEKEGK